ncbi:MAG: hypothetical protein AAGI46_02080, partial [Planctomycetota bacterium]
IDPGAGDTGIIASNPVSIDAVIADELDVLGTEDAASIGTFVAVQPNGTAITRKNWARKALDYVAAFHAPGSDTFPHADLRYRADDPTLNARALPAADFTAASVPVEIFGLDSDLFLTPPESIGSELRSDEAYAEALSGIPGRINVNTAPLGVLKLLPSEVVATTGLTAAGTLATNAEFLFDPLAADGDGLFDYLNGPYDYVASRDGARLPFFGAAGEAINDSYDLLSVLPAVSATADDEKPFVADVTGRIDGAAVDAGVFTDETQFFDYDGSLDINATVDTTEAALGDVIRLSNLTSRQSDSYTVYIVLQAWENVDAPAGRLPRLVRQQRKAFIVDRSGVRPFYEDAAGNAQSWSDVAGELSGGTITVDQFYSRLTQDLETTNVPVR